MKDLTTMTPFERTKELVERRDYETKILEPLLEELGEYVERLEQWIDLHGLPIPNGGQVDEST